MNTHFRGGIWKQWIFWTQPGPTAFAAVQRIVDEVNAASPLKLKHEPGDMLIASVFIESDPRAHDGERVVGQTLDEGRPNHELFFATFVTLPELDRVGVLFLTEPLRSKDALNPDVPGIPANFSRTMQFDKDGRVSTTWVVSNEHDKVAFKANYPEAAITSRNLTPWFAEDYLTGNLAETLLVFYRSLPTHNFRFLERSQSSRIDLPRKDVEVKLNVTRYHDTDIYGMFNDAENQPVRLYEFDRVVRVQLVR